MEEIVHKGIISRSKDGKLQVELTDTIECSSCHIKGACAAGDLREKAFLLEPDRTDLQQGEQVSVHLTAKMAFSALFWAYIFPLVILILTVVVAGTLAGELMAGLIALIFLAVYYSLIYLSRNYFNRAFSLKIKKIES